MFNFKNKNSNDMGVYVREESFLGKAPMRYDSIEIEGKHGADLVELGYQNFEGTLNDVVIMNDNFDEVLHWLSGTGELIYMGKKTRVHFLDVYQIAKHKKTFSVPFIREPFWYDLEDDYSESWGANLIPNGWDSFQAVGDTENLIPDGWESFGVFPEVEPLGHYCKKVELKEHSGWYISYDTDFKAEPNTVYVVQWEYEHIEGFVPYLDIGTSLHPNGYSSDMYTSVIKADNNFRHEFKLRESDVENNRFYISFRLKFNQNYGKCKFGDIKIYEKGNETPKVKIKKIGGGLTRIQTWGGSDNIKLLKSIGRDNKDEHVLSTYVIPKNKSGRIYFQGVGVGSNIDVEKYLTISGKVDPYTNAQFRVVTHDVDASVDFIASDPIINRGDKPNLTLLKEKIDNGLTHIRAYGGQENGKLRFIANSEKVGEPLNLSMYIENNGSDISLHHDAPSTNSVIKQGYKGDFETQTEVSIGKYKYIGVGTEGHLDFIASAPLFIEGKEKPSWQADDNPRAVNEGTAPSQPLIKLTKGSQSTCEYEVNGVYFKYHFNNDDHVIIDCEEMEATYNGLPRNRHLTIGFEFPVLKPGDNVVKQISGDAKIEFKRKDRWL